MINIVDVILNYDPVYKITFDTDHILLFTIISWGEYKAIRRLVQSMPSLEIDVSEYLFKKCTIAYFSPIAVYKQDSEEDINNLFNIIPAGVVNTVSSAILSLSGSSDPETLMNTINEERIFSTTAIEDAISHVNMSVFGLNKDDIDNSKWDKVIRDFVHAENILQGLVPIPLDIQKKSVDGIDFSKENKDLDNVNGL